LDLVLDHSGAVVFLIDRVLHMLRGNNVAGRLPGPVRGLAHEIRYLAETRREPVLVLYQSRAIVDDACNSSSVKRRQTQLAAPIRHEHGIVLDVLGCALHLYVEVGFDLEELSELLIVAVEQLIYQGAADHDDFDFQRYRLGLERSHRHEAVLVSDILRGGFAGSQDPF
jgi:hypothetical protein